MQDNHRASAIAYIRRMMKQNGGDTERKLLSVLTPEEKRAYEECGDASQITVQDAVNIQIKAAEIMRGQDLDSIL